VKEPTNLLLLAYYYLPSNTSGVQRAVRLARYLPEYGVATSVIASSHSGELPDVASVSHVPNRLTLNSRARAMGRIAERVQRILPYNEQLPWVPHATEAARALMSRTPAAAVLSTSPPVATHLAAFRLKKRYGLKWIADFRDPILGNPGRPRRWAVPYDRALERLIFKHADAIISVTDAMAEEWKRRFPAYAHKIHVIWNGFDPADALAPAPLPVRNYRILAHVGVLYSQRHPTALLASIDRLVTAGTINTESFRLRFVGPVQEQGQLTMQPAVSSLMQKGCIEMPGALVPRTEANHEIATADFLLLLDIVNLSNVGYTVPAKIFDYILTGRPILAITDKNSPVDRILQNSGVLYRCIYHQDQDSEIDRKLSELLTLPSEPLSPSQWFLENFDGRRQAGRIAEIILGLIQS
jgi:glycosyltransferase involved in cell wall biosynthesis